MHIRTCKDLNLVHLWDQWLSSHHFYSSSSYGTVSTCMVMWYIAIEFRTCIISDTFELLKNLNVSIWRKTLRFEYSKIKDHDCSREFMNKFVLKNLTHFYQLSLIANKNKILQYGIEMHEFLYLSWYDRMIKNPSFVISVAFVKVVVNRVGQLTVSFPLFWLEVISCTERILCAFHRAFKWKTKRRFGWHIFNQRANI